MNLCVFSLRPVPSNLVFHCHTSKMSLGRRFKTYSFTGFFRTVTKSQTSQETKQINRISPAICLKVASVHDCWMILFSFFSFPDQTFIFHTNYCFLHCLLSLYYLSSLSSPAAASPCLHQHSGLRAA